MQNTQNDKAIAKYNKFEEIAERLSAYIAAESDILDKFGAVTSETLAAYKIMLLKDLEENVEAFKSGFLSQADKLSCSEKLDQVYELLRENTGKHLRAGAGLTLALTKQKSEEHLRWH